MYTGSWGSTPNPGAASPQECSPRPRWHSAPNPVQEGVLGQVPPARSGGRVPSHILAAKPPRGLGRSPNRRGPLAPLWLLYATVYTYRCPLLRRGPYTIGNGGVESDKPQQLTGLSRWLLNDHEGLTCQVVCPWTTLTFGLIGFENKFSPPSVFETGASIEPPMSETMQRTRESHCSAFRQLCHQAG